jgi:hypothetical protein
MYRADVVVLKYRGGLGFADKSIPGLRLARKTYRKEFECDCPPEVHIFGTVHHPHTSMPDLINDSIMGDLFSGSIFQRKNPPNASAGQPFPPGANTLHWETVCLLISKERALDCREKYRSGGKKAKK